MTPYNYLSSQVILMSDSLSNYETQNVSLWLRNKYGFQKLARQFNNYKRLIPHLQHNFGQMTPDGVLWNDPKVNVKELNKMLKEM